MSGTSRTRSGVFISYSRKDGELFARSLREMLLSRRVVVWQDVAGMEGGRDWWEQIKDALNQVEFMVLVMTPAAMQSPVVRREWRYARQQGVCVYPVAVGTRESIGTVPRWMRDVHWYDLESQTERFFNDINTRCRMRRVPFMAEDLPVDFVPRDAKFAQIKEALIDSNLEEPVAITAALRGVGGYGKTTLARAICHDEDIQNAFDDGILWVTFGESPSQADLITKMTDLIETLSGERPGLSGIEAAATRFREVLADRDMLLVLDDVWRSHDVRPFLQGGERCARLITTRLDETLPQNAKRFLVDEMLSAEARRLIVTGLPENEQAERLTQLVERLRGWPLLIKLANSMLRRRLEGRQSLAVALDNLESALAKKGLTAFDVRDPQQRNDAVSRTLDASIEWLDAGDRPHCFALAVFREDVSVPTAVLQRLWGLSGETLDAFEVDELCGRLYSASLLQEFDLSLGYIRLHDTIREYLVRRLPPDEMVKLHERLLAGYLTEGGAWETIPDEGYIHRSLAYHLRGSNRTAELRALLLNLKWMQTRLDASMRSTTHGGADVSALLADYDSYSDDPEVGPVRRTLQMSAHVLGPHPEQLAAQLFGRLWTSHSDLLKKLHVQARESRKTSGPLVGLWPALNPPGLEIATLTARKELVTGVSVLNNGRRALAWSDDGPLWLWDLERAEPLYSLVGHAGPVLGLCMFCDERHALSWAADYRLILWNVEQGAALHTLEGHKGWINGAHVCADERSALSWSDRGELKLWDLESGELLHDFVGHHEEVRGACVLADGRRVLSWSSDATLRVWDLEQGGTLHVLAGHGHSVNDACLLDDPERVLSWSLDGTLKLWSAVSGELLHSFESHSKSVFGACVLPGGRRALSWSADCTLKLWDLESGALLQTFTGHDLAVYGACVLAGGQRVLSWSRDGTLKLWDLQQGELRTLRGHEREISGACVLGDSRVLSWSEDSTLKLWHPEHGNLLQTFVGHDSGVVHAYPLANSRRVLTLSDGGTLKLWELERREHLPPLASHSRGVGGTLLLADGRRGLSWSDDGVLKLWGLEHGNLLRALEGHDTRVGGVYELEGGRRALSWSIDGWLNLWDLEHATLLHTFAGDGGSPNGVSVLANGRVLSCSATGSLALWELESGQLLRTMEAGKRVFGGEAGCAVLDSSRVLFWSANRVLSLWELDSGGFLFDLVGHEDLIRGACALAGGDRVLSWSRDGTLRVWATGTGELLHTLRGHFGRPIDGARVLADGRRALSWAEDRGLVLWDLESGELLQTLNGHEGPVRGVCVLGDDRRAVSWSVDSTLRLWDLGRGERLHTLAGHENWIMGAYVLGSGDRVLSWSLDRTLRMWDLERGKLLSTYYSDASLHEVAVDEARQRAFFGDALGRLHLVSFKTDA